MKNFLLKLFLTVKKAMLKSRFTTAVGIFFKWLLKKGPRAAVYHLKHFLAFDRYQIGVDIDPEERKRQEAFVFENNIKFSVLVPLYNTPEAFLKEMIESVLNQTYKNFELCLADGSDENHSYVARACRRFAEKDKRVVYKKLKENKGIAENTNECIKMSTGDYIALFDHDDLLHPSALFKVALAINNENADFVYTDEFTFDGSKGPKAIISRHFKPDFSYDNLLANNYICHLSVFKSSLLDEVGIFRTKYDGSQDHDMILRLTCAAKKIVHIPEMLYFWRSHKDSVAMDITSKPYTIKSGINLVSDHLKDRGIKARVESSPIFPVIYRVTYEVLDNPKVTILICSDNKSSALASAKSVSENTDYENYEIIIALSGEAYKACGDEFESIQRVKLLEVKSDFNKPYAYNLSSAEAVGDYLVFLNSACKPRDASWLKELLGFAQLEYAGAVGAKVMYESGIVKSNGKIVGFGDDIEAERHVDADKSELGFFGKLYYSQNVSAVCSDCFMVKRSDFQALKGFDTELKSGLFDTDLCLRLMEMGRKNITNPYSVITSPEKIKKANNDEKQYFKTKWADFLDRGDPYYNKSLPEGYYYF